MRLRHRARIDVNARPLAAASAKFRRKAHRRATLASEEAPKNRAAYSPLMATALIYATFTPPLRHIMHVLAHFPMGSP